jgi:hypothetical protein
MQRWILDELREGSEGQATAELLELYKMFEKPRGPDRSVLNSMQRALRSLNKGGHIQSNEGKWEPIGEWPGRDLADEGLRQKEAERKETAFHEAGHAVIGLAGQLPIAFVTIRQKGNKGGYVTSTNGPHKVGYVIKDYRIVANLETDAFGNQVPQRTVTDKENHAEVLMCIAGPMAEAHWKRDHTKWRQDASPSDISIARYHRRELGKGARDWSEYEADTFRLITDHWDKIEAVAIRLLEDETISGPDVDDICCRIARRDSKRKAR